ncbi:MAG: hemolysin family protein [Anaerolineae bacterium]
MSKPFLIFIGIPGMSLLILLSAAVGESLPGISSLIAPAIIILLLVILNAFFVAAEFSIIGVRPTQLGQMASDGNKLAGRVLGIVETRLNQDRYIATAQLGITMASLGLAMYGEPKIASFIEPFIARLLSNGRWAAVAEGVGGFVALGLLTYLHVVVGEMVPKSVALSDAPRVVLLVVRPMQLAQAILITPVRILNQIGVFLLRLLRIPPAEGHARVLSPEELELIVTESAEGGLLNEDEEEMIRNIFDFSERVAGQVMTPRTRVQAVPHDLPWDELLRLVTESRHSRFPVIEGDLDHVIGVLHLKDLVRQTLKGQGGFDIRLILRPAPAVPEDYPVERLLAGFKQQRLHMAIVLDEFGGMAGIVTLEDLVEEIVGEVRDEFDLEKEPYMQIAPGVLELAGNYLVDDLVEKVYLGEEEKLPDVETVGGLIVTWLGRPPERGDEVTCGHVRFRVLDVDRRAVSRVRIEFPVPDEENNEDWGGADSG